MALSIPKEMRQLGQHLLNQQIWCWGRDVCYPDKNLLIEYGFQRIPLPDGARGHSNYLLCRPKQTQVMLWGFGLFYGQPSLGGLFLKRFEFKPRWLPLSQLTPPICSPDLIPARLPHSAETIEKTVGLLTEALSWLADYESWVMQTVGLPHRQQAVASWRNGKRKVLPAESMVPNWQKLADYWANTQRSWAEATPSFKISQVELK